MDVGEIVLDGVEQIYLAHNMDRWPAFVNMVMYLLIQ
jgi:hypothetical protein